MNMETKIIESETARGLSQQITDEQRYGWEPQGDIMTFKTVEKVYNADASLRGAVPREVLAVKLVRHESASRYWAQEFNVLLDAPSLNRRAQRRRLRELSEEESLIPTRMGDWR